MLKAVVATAAALLLALPAVAQTATEPPGEQTAAAPNDFATRAASMGMAEVALGKVGAQKAQSPDIQQFAQHLSKDHSGNNQKLQAAAQQAGVQVPTQLQPEEQQAVDRLSAMSGAEFDRAFLDQMVKDHQKAIQLYQQQAQAGTAPQLKDYATQTLPALQKHLEDAQALAARQRG